MRRPSHRRKRSSLKGERLEGTVRALAHGGEAVVETPKGLVFAPFGLPGERVRLSGVHSSGSVLRGRVDAVISDSPQRIRPACPLLHRCGGCLLMPLSIDAQRAHKQTLVQSAVDQAGESGAVQVAFHAEGPVLGYRRRARLHWSRRGSLFGLGYRPHRSRDVVDVEHCAVLAPALARGLDAVRRELAPRLEGEGEVWLGSGVDGSAVVALRSEHVQPPVVYVAAEELARAEGIGGVALRVGGATLDAVWGDPRECIGGVDGDPLLGAVAGFSQANDVINRRLVSRVIDLAEPRDASVLELYAGCGNLTMALAQAGAREVVSVEQDRASAEACRENLIRRGLVARVITADAAEACARSAPVDVVVLDPPRMGARPLLRSLVSLRPRRIVYVSCDPATLGRDLRELGAMGFAVDRAEAFDMFPQTAHIEALVRLTPSPAARS